MAMTPKSMYRARDAQGNMGILFVLADPDSPKATVLFRPDSDDIPSREEVVPDLLCWGRASVLKGIVVHYDRPIPVEEGTTQVRVVRASMPASPFMVPGGHGG
jgi:hypothetical protein